VHPEHPLSALLSMHAKVDQGQQVSQRHKRGIHAPPDVIRRGIKGNDSAWIEFHGNEADAKDG
jgi:hypothetical protein